MIELSTDCVQSMKASGEELQLRNKQFFASADIDVRLSTEVLFSTSLVSFLTFLLNSDHAVNNNHCLCQATSILTEKKEVKLGNGAVLPYTKLLLATGSKYVINKLTRNLVVFVSN